MTKTRPNGIAPSSARFRLGGKGGRVAQAWQFVWDRLDHENFQDGTVLAALAAQKYDLKPDSVTAYMYRMAEEGILDHRLEQVQTEVFRAGKTMQATRARRHYRIAK
jgi:hypothetical protein